MPQIANQDYNIVAPQYASSIFLDAAALGQIAGHIERGTIWDIILDGSKDASEKDFSRVYGLSKDIAWEFYMIFFWDCFENEAYGLEIWYTQSQYEGLAAVQEACGLVSHVPILVNKELSGGTLVVGERYSEKYICVDGKHLGYEEEDGTITGIIFTNVEATPGTFVNITAEDAQKLVGVQIG
jgi:hypothetical protein